MERMGDFQEEGGRCEKLREDEFKWEGMGSEAWELEMGACLIRTAAGQSKEGAPEVLVLLVEEGPEPEGRCIGCRMAWKVQDDKIQQNMINAVLTKVLIS